ncbi:hypothetical protein ES703_26102 [subsurface metagenome]
MNRIILAIVVSLLLVCSFPNPVQADTDHGGVDLSATVALAISDVSSSSIGYHSAIISWATNGNATSQVFYDTTGHENINDYAYQTEEDAGLITEHSITLTGFSSSTTYHYRARSAIGTEFIAISEDYTFTTATPPPAAGGGGGVPSYYTRTNLFGTEPRIPISYSGELKKTVEVTSEDGNLTITIPKGTVALGKDGKRLKRLEASVDESPPAPPEDAHIIGLAYNFGPAGATFDPGITFTWSYDPDALPEGVDPEDLVLAYYDGEKWVELDCVVDTENNTITALVPHFTTFAIIGRVPAPAPPAPAPAAFTFSSLEVSPSELAPGEEVNISVQVANTGGKSGSYTVVLKINGVKEAEKSVKVAAGESQEVSFSVAKEDPGSYSVVVAGLRAMFAVVEPVLPPPPPPPPPPGPDWPVVGGIIGAAVVLLAIVGFFVWRRLTKALKHDRAGRNGR